MKKYGWIKKEIKPVKTIDDAVKNFHIKLANELLEEDIKNNVYDLNDPDDLKTMKKDYEFWLNDLAAEHNEIIYKKLNYYNVNDYDNQAFYDYVEEENTRTNNPIWLPRYMVEDAVGSAYYLARKYLYTFFKQLKNNFTKKEWELIIELEDGEYFSEFVDFDGNICITDYELAKDFIDDWLSNNFIYYLNDILQIEYICTLIDNYDITKTNSYQTDIKKLEKELLEDAYYLAKALRKSLKEKSF